MEIIIDTNILFDDKQLKGQKLHRLTNKVKENPSNWLLSKLSCDWKLKDVLHIFPQVPEQRSK